MAITIVTIILNYNGKSDTYNCIKSLNKLIIPKGINHQVVVVDNNSQDDSVNYLSAKFPKLKIITNNQNSGFTGGNNLGVVYAREIDADWVFLLNNDTISHSNLLNNLYTFAQTKPQSVILSQKIYFAPHREYHHQRYTQEDIGKVIWYAGGVIDWDNLIISHRGIDEVDQGQYDQPTQIPVATGCSMLIHKKLWQEQDLFDNRYYLYYEDSDLCLRINDNDQIWYVPSAKLWHINSSSSGSGSNLHDYYLTRNRLLLGQRYAPLRTKLSLIRESFKILISGRPYQKRGVRDFYLRNFGKGRYF